jgi:DNA/RNA-binding protein KIN17
MSESHQRQLLLVADNPGKFVGNFSDEFLKGFMDILRRQYGTRRVHCNVVYQEYIRDKDHYHMNATRWSTLTGFVMWLGRQGLCDVEPTSKGWYITYIDNSPEALARQASDAKKVKMDRDDDERTQLMIEDQIVRAMALKKCNGE